MKKTVRVAQVDGGPGMDDDSSSEEGEDEDPLQRLADLNDDDADDDDVVEEEPYARDLVACYVTLCGLGSTPTMTKATTKM